MNKDILELSKLMNFPIIDNETNFWFVRTESGTLYKEFFFGNYIGIGWDNIGTIKFIQDSTHEQLKAEVEKAYPDNKRPGYVANQLFTFVREMKKGDYVVIPSESSEVLAFGIIESDIYEQTNNEAKDTQHLKRHKVNWIQSRKRDTLDSYLYRIIYSHNTIVDAESYASNILQTLYDQFYYDEKFYSVIRIEKKDSISGISLSRFMMDSIDYIEQVSGQTLDDTDLEMKISINSPGIIAIAVAATLVIFAVSGFGIMLAGGKVETKTKFENLEHEGSFETNGLIDAISRYKNNKQNNRLAETERKLIEAKGQLEIKQNNDKEA